MTSSQPHTAPDAHRPVPTPTKPAAGHTGTGDGTVAALSTIQDVPDDFWPIIEAICDQAARCWESSDPRMKYVEVQIDKADLDVLRAAYGAAPMYGTDGEGST